MFNDFGPKAVRYFVDKNRNRRLDRGESLSGEMIHTTPEDEAATVRHEGVSLQPSHGCIHVSPTMRDQLAAAGAFKARNTLVIHRYEEAVPAAWKRS